MKREPHIEVYPDKSNRRKLAGLPHRWRTVAANGKGTSASGESFPTLDHAWRAAERFRFSFCAEHIDIRRATS